MMVTMYSLHSTPSLLSLPSSADNSRTTDVKMVIMTFCGQCRLLSDWYRIVCHNEKISPNNNTIQYLRVSPSTQEPNTNIVLTLPIISQPQCGSCHRDGTGQGSLEVIGSKQSYALKWCKPNNDDDIWS